MRKLPDHCPTEAWYSRVWGFCWNHDPDEEIETEVEIHPIGSRALTAELVKMVERLLTDADDCRKSQISFSNRLISHGDLWASKERLRASETEAAALLAMAREGEGA